MLVVKVIPFLLILVEAVSLNFTTNNNVSLLLHTISPITYQQLVNLISLCSVSYCSTKGLLSTGKFSKACDLKYCQQNGDYQVLKIFQPQSDNIGSSGYIAINHLLQKIFIVFRGSQTDVDWLTDLEFTPIPYRTHVSNMGLLEWDCDNCMVHKGFHKSVNFFIKDSLNFVLKLTKTYRNYELIVTGHSLGGALALLTGIEFQSLGFNPLVVTFAQPKIAATFTFADKINEIFHTSNNKQQSNSQLSSGYFRVTHNGDKIPLLPPGFVHAGIEFNIKKVKLPHTRSDVIVEEETTSLDLVEEQDFKDIKKSLKNALLKEHGDYLIKVSGCKNR